MDKATKKKWIIAIIIAVAVALILEGVSHYKKESTANIAVVRVEGVINAGENGADIWSGSSAGANTLMNQLKKARLDKSVKGVLLRIDSPGGSAAASQEIAEEIQRVKEAGKPVYVSMGDSAASGGYWLAAQGNKIYANPGTITGSIGVYMGYNNVQGLYEKLGVKEEKIKSGPHKDMMSPTREMTPDERALVQAMVDDLYQQFVDVIVKGRHMDPAKVKQLADGRVYTGRQAKELGLVDELGNYYDALSALAESLGLDTEEIPTIEYEDESLWGQLFGKARVEMEKSFGLHTTSDMPRVQMR